MGQLKLNFEWCASWEQNDCFYCTLFIKEDYMDTAGFQNFLESTFGKRFGGWKYVEHRHGVEIWFKKKEDMLTFKLLAQTQYTMQ